MRHLYSTVACDVYVISVSSENLLHDTGGALKNCGTQKNKQIERKCHYYSVEGARSKRALGKRQIWMGKSKNLNLKASVVYYLSE